MSPPPFFIIGAQRSGTTLLRLMLNNHPNIAIPFESVFISQFWRQLDKYGDLRRTNNAETLLRDIARNKWVKWGKLIPDVDAVLGTRPESYSKLVDAIFTEYARKERKTRWGDKTPTYTTEMDILHKVFPKSRFVHLVRDGRGVALSLAKISWGTSHVPRAAEDWRWKTTLAHKMGMMIEDRYLEVRFENLIADTVPTLRQICEFLGEEYSEAMLNYPRSGESQMPGNALPYHKTSVLAPDRSKVNAWKTEMLLSDQIIFDEHAGDALDLFGYPRSEGCATLKTRFRRLHYKLVHRW